MIIKSNLWFTRLIPSITRERCPTPWLYTFNSAMLMITHRVLSRARVGFRLDFRPKFEKRLGRIRAQNVKFIHKRLPFLVSLQSYIRWCEKFLCQTWWIYFRWRYNIQYNLPLSWLLQAIFPHDSTTFFPHNLVTQTSNFIWIKLQKLIYCTVYTDS